MAQTTINGGTQIKSGTIPLSALVSGYSVPTANLVDGANFVKKDGSVTLTGALNLGGYAPTNSGSPVNATDVATKGYVDTKAGGIGGIHEVTATISTSTSISSAASTYDGVTPVSGTSVILLTGQSTASQNGPWVWNGGGSALTRPTWWASAATITTGHYFLVGPGGTTYGDTKWFCTNTSSITVDTTSTTFVQDLSGTTYTAGTGLTLTGGSFSVNYGTTSTTAAVGNDSRITGALQTSSLGTNVATALGVAVGSAGAFVTNGGALGTPSSGTLTNATGLPISTGVSGLGSGVATALAITAGSGSGFALLSSGVLTAGEFPALTGDVTTTAGSLTTTVNNTSGSGFVKYTDFIWNETPSGTVNGSNATFTLANTPANTSTALALYLNGVLQEPGSGNDFTISGATITMLNVPATGDKLRVNYLK